MAGNSGNHIKVKTGPLKGRQLYISGDQQRQLAAKTMGSAAYNSPTLASLRAAVMARVESGNLPPVILSPNNAPLGSAAKGGAFAGTEGQQLSQKQGFEAAKQMRTVIAKLQMATDPQEKATLAQRQNALQNIIQGAQYRERMVQLAPDQKTLRLKAVQMLRDEAQKTVNAWQEKLDKLNNTVASGGKNAQKLLDSNRAAAAYARDQMKGMVQSWSDEAAILSEPAIPGKKLFVGPSNEELLADLPLSFAQRDKLLATKKPALPKTSGVSMTGGTTISGFFGNNNAGSFAVYREGAGMEMTLGKWNAALVDAFAAKFGATAKRVKVNTAEGSTVARAAFSWPGGSGSIPSAEAMLSWFKSPT